MEPITREDYENSLIPMKATEVVRQTTDFLIAMLFKPHKKLGYIIDRDRIRRYVGTDKEPVNYGDLHCSYVEEQDGVFHVHIEEASPEAYQLKAYLKCWLEDWGWPVIVELEW